MSARDIAIPDIGDFEDVPVVEVHVAVGDRVEVEQPLVTLESDKASMDVPAPFAGTITELQVSVGDTVREGTVIARAEPEEAGDEGGEARDRWGPAGEAEPKPRASEEARDPGRSTAPPTRAAEGDAREGTTEETDRETTEARTAGGKTDREETTREHTRGPDRTRAPEAAPPAHQTRATGTSPPSAPRGPGSSAPGPDARSQGRPRADVEASLVVLGAGPGGYTAAFRAADLGLETVLVDRWAELGGVCLNVGCIPSKALLHAAKVITDAEDMGELGLRFGRPEIDLEALRAWKDGVVHKLTSGLGRLAKQRKVRVLRGSGTFTGPRTLSVEGPNGTVTVAFDQAIVAAGSEPARLPFFPEGNDRIMDSTGALALRDIPERLLVVGGGIIGMEMACVYEALGSKVTVVELTDGLMPGADRDLVRPLERRMSRRLEKILLSTKVTGCEARSDGLEVTFENAKEGASTVTYDRVLVCVGRRPNGEAIGLDATGVRVDDRGFVPVDNRLRTNVPHIFAIGDIVGPPMLAHKATHEGKTAAEVAAGQPVAFDARAIPSVAYTDPEVAWVGLTETEAKGKGVAYEKGSFPWAASGRALGMARDEGLTKILFDPDTHRVIGGGIVGPSAGDLISEIGLALEMGADAADLGLTVHPHPTLSETVAMSAEAFEGTITDLYVPKRPKKTGPR